MIALKAYYDDQAFIPLEKPVVQKKSCRGLASKYANLSLVEQENSIAEKAFSRER